MSNKTGLGAYFDGAFSEYDINISKSMQGYFIISKKGGYNSELIGEDVEELVFKDCTKSIDEIKELIKNKKLSEQVKTHIFANEHGIDENADFKAMEAQKNLEIKTKQESQTKQAIPEPINQEPKSKPRTQKALNSRFAINEISKKESKKPSFEIEEITTQDKEEQRPAFEIISQNIEEIIAEESKEINSKIENKTPSSQIKNSIELEKDEPNEQSEAKIKADEQIQSNEPSKQSKAEKSSLGDEKIYFAKNICLPKGKIAEIEILITGYDEFCDSFYFDEIPDDCEYKYSIKKGELRALFIADLTNEQARSFIGGFSFKTSRQISKHIEIFINAGFSPTFRLTLFG